MEPNRNSRTTSDQAVIYVQNILSAARYHAIANVPQTPVYVSRGVCEAFSFVHLHAQMDFIFFVCIFPGITHLHVRHRTQRAHDLRDAEVNDEEHEDDDRREEAHVHHSSPVAVVQAQRHHLRQGSRQTGATHSSVSTAKIRTSSKRPRRLRRHQVLWRGGRKAIGW